MENEAKKAEGSEGAVFGWFGSVVLACLAAGLFLVLPILLMLDYLGEQRIARQTAAGTLVAVHPVGSWNADSLVETTAGFYPVLGLVSLPRGVEFVLETRDNGAQFLCEPRRTFCGRVLGNRIAESLAGGGRDVGSPP